MKQKIFSAVVLIFAFVIASTDLAAQEKEIAVTIDDLPLNGPQFDAARLKRMTGKFLTGIKEHRIPAVGFVNESLLYQPNETDVRIAILKSWVDAGVELGNHTFSHTGFKNAALADYQDDFVRGDAVTRMIQKDCPPRYFRHPFLQMGPTLETEKTFREFIARRGYRAAPVTIDTVDWMFSAAYAKALKEKDEALKKRVADEYLEYVGKRFDHAEKFSKELFGRPVRHILLMHANELSADNFDALIKVIKKKGYRFITLERALEDEIYRFPDKYNATSDWLSMWAYSKGMNLNAPAPPTFIQEIFNGR